MKKMANLTKRLIIIGNGFDLHHQIASKYSDFASYLERVDKHTFNIAEDYVVPEKDLWNYLESRLAEIDVDQIQDYAQNFLVPYGADDWSDSSNHDYEYEIEQICGAISNNLRKHFADWVRQIAIPLHVAAQVQCIDPGAVFLNFNYTPTLQNTYGIPDSRILHIHGSASNPSAEIILGHGWERTASDLLSHFIDEDTDVRVAGGYHLIDDTLANTFKPTQKIISNNSAFFNGLSSIKEVFVLGHSLAQVDEPYFNEVLRNVHQNANWTVSFHGDHIATRYAAIDIGIPNSKLRLETLTNL